jgi:hypothetical protein
MAAGDPALSVVSYGTQDQVAKAEVTGVPAALHNVYATDRARRCFPTGCVDSSVQAVRGLGRAYAQSDQMPDSIARVLPMSVAAISSDLSENLPESRCVISAICISTIVSATTDRGRSDGEPRVLAARRGSIMAARLGPLNIGPMTSIRIMYIMLNNGLGGLKCPYSQALRTQSSRPRRRIKSNSAAVKTPA